MEGVCAIVPFRSDADGFRRRNAQIVLNWLATAHVRTLLVEHSDVPEPSLDLPTGTTRLHVRSGGHPFNKALACNVGFRAAGAPIMAFVDADTMTSSPALVRSIEAVGEQFDVVRPFGRIVDLDEEQTHDLATRGEMPEVLAMIDVNDRSGEHVPICGGIVIMRSDAYRRAGGMDESFKGWGGEDTAFAAALERCGTHRGVLTSQTALHLHHPRPLEDRYLHADYAANHARARWWTEGPDDEIDQAMRQGAARLG